MFEALTVRRRAGGRGWELAGKSLEGRGGDGGDACGVVSSSARGWENVWDCVMLGGAGEVGLFGLILARGRRVVIWRGYRAVAFGVRLTGAVGGGSAWHAAVFCASRATWCSVASGKFANCGAGA